MKVVSTTLAGPGTASIIGDALRSVAPFVDEHVIIITTLGITDEYDDSATLANIGDACEGRDNYRIYKWCDDFGAARNAALDFARAVGADWAITVDTDERVITHGEDVRAILASTTGAGLLSTADDETYSKPRAIRLASGARWVGRTHESIAITAQGDLRTFPLLRFSELPKTPAEMAAKFARDERMLRADIDANPSDTRAWYYLGATLHGIGYLDDAIDAFRQCAHLDGWYEESAFACVRAAELLCQRGRHREAIAACALGLTRDAGMAELAIVAGHACLALGEREQARCWARLAEVHGLAGDGRALARRLGFRRPVALRDGAAAILAAVGAGIEEGASAGPVAPFTDSRQSSPSRPK